MNMVTTTVGTVDGGKGISEFLLEWRSHEVLTSKWFLPLAYTDNTAKFSQRECFAEALRLQLGALWKPTLKVKSRKHLIRFPEPQG